MSAKNERQDVTQVSDDLLTFLSELSSSAHSAAHQAHCFEAIRSYVSAKDMTISNTQLNWVSTTSFFAQVSATLQLHRAPVLVQWQWVTSFSCIVIPQVQAVDPVTAERHLNLLNKLIGVEHPWSRALACSFVKRLSTALNPSSRLLPTQLTIIVKNLTSSFNDSRVRPGYELCQVVALGSIVGLTTHWIEKSPSHPYHLQEFPFATAALKLLFALLHITQVHSKQEFLLRYNASDGLRAILLSKSLWRSLPSQMRHDILRELLAAVRHANEGSIDDMTLAMILRTFDSEVFETTLNLPNYLSSLLSALLQLLPPLHTTDRILLDMRWEVLTLLARFLTTADCRSVSPVRGTGRLSPDRHHTPSLPSDWESLIQGGCGRPAQLERLHTLILAAHSRYCRNNSIPSTRVKSIELPPIDFA